MNDLEVADFLERAANELPSAPHRTLDEVRHRARQRHRRRTVSGAAMTIAVALAVGGLVFATDWTRSPIPPAAPVITTDSSFGPVQALATLCTADQNCSEYQEADILAALEAVSTDDVPVRVLRVIGSQPAGETVRPRSTRVVLELGATAAAERLVDRVVAIDGVHTLTLGTADTAPNAGNDGGTDATVVDRRQLTIPVEAGTEAPQEFHEIEFQRLSNGQYCLQRDDGHACGWPTVSDRDELSTSMATIPSAGGGTICADFVVGRQATEVRLVDEAGTALPVTSVRLVPELSRPSLHIACWQRHHFDATAVEIESPDGQVTTHQLHLP